jgi:hypothetical protein
LDEHYYRLYNTIHCRDVKTENSKHIFPEKELRGHSPNSYVHVSVYDLCVPTIGLHILLQKIGGPIVGISKSLLDNVEIGTEAAQILSGNT